MKYRRDIDGMRALAVLPVLFYHAGIPTFSGGYVGVDVFFVISGFLITTIVSRELSAGEFSLIDFYERRARRILPALSAVILFSFAISWLVLLPGELENLGESALAAAIFLSNVYFAVTTDYFAGSGEYAPLLHTWSLAVEEQFYLVFPPLLMLIFAWRGQKSAFWITACLSLISLILSVLVLPVRSEWVFYLIPFRAWELGVGALLALFAHKPPNSRALREILGGAGLLCVLIPVFLYDSSTLFPGIAAIPPVIGAALLIYVGAGKGASVASSVLANGLLVSIGLISYSLYLWHWPLLSFLRIVFGTIELPWTVAVAAILMSLALAWISWNFIERPFRKRGTKGFGRGMIFGLSAVTILSIVVVGLASFVTQGFPSRVTAEVQIVDSIAGQRNKLSQTCMSQFINFDDCLIGAKSKRSESLDFVFWGDSHAGAIAPGVSKSAASRGFLGLFVAHPGCLPVFDLTRLQNGETCTSFLNEVRTFLERRSEVKTIILHARWALSVEGTRYKVEGEPDVRLKWTGEGSHLPSQLDNQSLFEFSLRKALGELTSGGRTVIILGPTPEINYNVPSKIARAEMLGFDLVTAFDYTIHRERSSRTESILKQIAADTKNVKYLPLGDLLCSPQDCSLQAPDKIPHYVDDDHVSTFTAERLISSRIDDAWQLVDGRSE